MFSLLLIRGGRVSDEDFLGLGFSKVTCRSSKLEAPPQKDWLVIVVPLYLACSAARLHCMRITCGNPRLPDFRHWNPGCATIA